MRSDYGRTINDLLLLKGDIAGRSAAAIGQARAREQEILGQLWGQAINNVGQIAASVPQQLQERRRLQMAEANQRAQMADRDAQAAERQQKVSDANSLDQAFSPAAALGPQGVGPMPENAQAPTRDQILNAVPGHLRGKVQETFAEADKLAEQSRASRQKAQKDAQEYAGFLGAQIHQAGYDPHIANLTLDHAAESHQDDPDTLKQIDQMRRAIQQDPNAIKPMAQAAMLGSSYKSLLEPKTREIRTRNADGSEAVQIVKDEAGQQFNSAPVPEKPPTAGSFEDYVRRYADGKGKPVAQLTTADIEDARKRYQQADDRPPNPAAADAASDVKATIAGMKAGTLPPNLPGRASKEYVALMAEAQRQGFDLAGAATDWAATQKHIATLNGAQQTRLNQAINSLPDMLDSVDALAAKWKAGRFALLNKANLALAKGGAYGEDAASIANQLDAQIADVTADLGNVYMGGNSPTDHALSLAGKSLSADWDEKVLHDMTALARQNVTIRRNSIRNTGVQGASPNNPYGQPAPTQGAGTVRMRAPNGQERDVSAAQVEHYKQLGAVVVR